MYTTCIIWLAFIPIYFGTGNSFEVVLLSSYGLIIEQWIRFTVIARNLSQFNKAISYARACTYVRALVLIRVLRTIIADRVPFFRKNCGKLTLVVADAINLLYLQ